MRTFAATCGWSNMISRMLAELVLDVGCMFFTAECNLIWDYFENWVGTNFEICSANSGKFKFTDRVQTCEDSIEMYSKNFVRYLIGFHRDISLSCVRINERVPVIFHFNLKLINLIWKTFEPCRNRRQKDESGIWWMVSIISCCIINFINNNFRLKIIVVDV